MPESPEEYKAMLLEMGLKPNRMELLSRDIKHAGPEGLAGWFRTTWLLYTEWLPMEMRDLFVKEIINRYLKNHPADAEGVIHLGMVRLEVEAYIP